MRVGYMEGFRHGESPTTKGPFCRTLEIRNQDDPVPKDSSSTLPGDMLPRDRGESIESLGCLNELIDLRRHCYAHLEGGIHVVQGSLGWSSRDDS